MIRRSETGGAITEDLKFQIATADFLRIGGQVMFRLSFSATQLPGWFWGPFIKTLQHHQG